MPVHRHHGGMIEACYSQPADLYDEVQRAQELDIAVVSRR